MLCLDCWPILWPPEKNMKNALLSLAGAFLLALAGCVQSLHPLYSADDLIFDPQLLGCWTDQAGQETWIFRPRSEQAYSFIYLDEQAKSGEFIARLLQVGEHRFLDLYPADLKTPHNSYYNYHWLPVHTFLRLRQDDAGIQIELLKPDWLKQELQANPAALKHEQRGSTIILTATPKELQAFLILHANAPGAWEKSKLMQRPTPRPGQ